MSEPPTHFGAESLQAVERTNHQFEIGDETVGVELNEIDRAGALGVIGIPTLQSLGWLADAY